MNNQKFVLVSESEKRQKLGTVLRCRTHDALTAEQLRYIIMGILPDVQYGIEVFTDPQRFCNALNLEKESKRPLYGKIVFGQALFGEGKPGHLYQERESAAAILTDGTDPDSPTRTLLIYVPVQLYEKGTKGYEQ
jgi:hypothetical protein